MSPSSISMSRPCRFVSGLLGRTSARTAKPDPTNARTTAEPIKPDAPVTNVRTLIDTTALAFAVDDLAAPIADEMSGLRKSRGPNAERLQCSDGIDPER